MFDVFNIYLKAVMNFLTFIDKPNDSKKVVDFGINFHLKMVANP